MRCDECKWWEPDADPSTGQCRVSAPVAGGGTGGTAAVDLWPKVTAGAWCGEFARVKPSAAEVAAVLAENRERNLGRTTIVPGGRVDP
jgi:hypothetical protein